MTDIAHELSRRASPAYISDRAKETALNKTNEWKDRLGTSPMALGVIGGTIGALLGRAFAKEQRDKAERAYGWRSRPAFAEEVGVRYGSVVDTRGIQYGSDGMAKNEAGVGEKIAGAAHDLKDKAGDLVANVRDRMPSAAEVGQKADENPLLVALGGLALGAVAALLLPVSRKERELLEPVKQKAGEAIGTLSDKVAEGVDHAQQKIAGPERQGQPPLIDPGYTPMTH